MKWEERKLGGRKQLGNERYESGCGGHVLIEIKTNFEQIGGIRREIKEKGKERVRKEKGRILFLLRE